MEEDWEGAGSLPLLPLLALFQSHWEDEMGSYWDASSSCSQVYVLPSYNISIGPQTRLNNVPPKCSIFPELQNVIPLGKELL